MHEPKYCLVMCAAEDMWLPTTAFSLPSSGETKCQSSMNCMLVKFPSTVDDCAQGYELVQ